VVFKFYKQAVVPTDANLALDGRLSLEEDLAVEDTVSLTDSASRNMFLNIFEIFKVRVGFQIRSQIWQGCSEVCFF
jgi:hypothetical protein